jgi:Putative DNA-binding domain
MFGKRPSELTPEDISRVVSEQVQEGSQIEFKGTLPAKGSAEDPWVAGRDQVGEFARNKLVEEVIAFANAYGGWLLVGIEETREKPARASAVVPIRDCGELAERLRLMCRDCIEPTLPILEVAGVAMGNDRGVLVFHVPKSRMAPHRHSVTKECYIRRADRSEKMTMREIQDLTLQVERGLAAIERQFQKQREQFASHFTAYRAGSTRAFGLRATLVPLTPIYVERVHGNEAASPPSHTLWGTIGDSKPYDLGLRDGGGAWRPIVRGTIKSESNRRFASSREVHCDGLIEHVVMHRTEAEEGGRPGATPFYLPIQWVMGLFGNALCAAEKFRRAAGAPDVEYGLKFDIASNAALPIGRYGGISFGETLGPLPEGTTFPRYSVGGTDQFQSLSETFERDFWNGAGLDPPNVAAVDFERALRELGLTTAAA